MMLKRLPAESGKFLLEENMSSRLQVLFQKKPSYDIVYSNNFDDLCLEFDALSIKERKVCIVTDDCVRKHYEKNLLSLLQENCIKCV